MVKIFGAAFDPLDTPERVDVKIAYLNWLKTHAMSENNFLDPYDIIENNLEKRYSAVNGTEWIGKFAVDSWLRPKPLISDLEYISQKKYTKFLDSNGCYDYYNKLVDYITKNVGSSIPVMIGIDHCLTGGVLRYLKDRNKNYNVLVFDSHCDLIDLEFRKTYYGPFLRDLEGLYGEKDIYECGSFLNYILKEEIIKPENLWIIGSQDLDKIKQNLEPLYSKKILPWIKKGMHIISKEDLILFGIPDEIEGQTYISFDMDLGSLVSVFAARFLNYIGLNEREFLNLIHELSEKVKTKKIELIGLDIMEIDIHFLGVEMNGNKDLTAEIASEIIDSIIYSNVKN